MDEQLVTQQGIDAPDAHVVQKRRHIQPLAPVDAGRTGDGLLLAAAALVPVAVNAAAQADVLIVQHLAVLFVHDHVAGDT